MKPARLTNEIRDAIVVKAIAQAFTQKKKDLEAAETSLADTVYAETTGQQGVLADRLGRDWFDYDSELQLVYCNTKVEAEGRAAYCRSDITLHMSQERPFPYDTSRLFLIKETHGTYDAVRKIEKSREDLEEAQTNLRVKLLSILNSVQTFKRLEEVWPEGKAFYSSLDPAPVYAIVPLSTIMELNTILGITPVTATTKALAKAAQ